MCIMTGDHLVVIVKSIMMRSHGGHCEDLSIMTTDHLVVIVYMYVLGLETI